MIRFLLLACVLCVVPLSSSLDACSTPVFQYALERWEADYFDLLIYHDQPLTKEQQTIAESIQRGKGVDTYFTPLSVQIIDTNTLTNKINDDDKNNKQDTNAEHFSQGNNSPRMVLAHNEFTGAQLPIWTGALSHENFLSLCFSPKRAELERRLCNGHSVVWFLFESGNTVNDEKMLTILERDLQSYADQANAETLGGLPDPDAVEADAEEEEDYDVYSEEEHPPVHLRFSVLPIGVDEEPLLKEMLYSLIPELKEQDGPIALPVFGQGRALAPCLLTESEFAYTLEKEFIFEMCDYLTGECSCEIKAQNPGFDLFIPADWEPAETVVPDPVAPELVGTLVGDEEIDREPQPQDGRTLSKDFPSTTNHKTSLALSPLLITGLAVLLLLILGTLIINRGEK